MWRLLKMVKDWYMSGFFEVGKMIQYGVTIA